MWWSTNNPGTRGLRRVLLTTVLVVWTTGLQGLAAQPERGDDLRDRLVLKNGRELRGRLETPFADEELILRQGGKRIRIPVGKVAERRTVREQVAEFVRLRTLAGEDLRKQWPLVDWAASRELGALARLQAMWVALHEPAHTEAHEFLGHRQRSDEAWLWPDPPSSRSGRVRYVDLDTLEQNHQGHGQALRLRSEHFEILSDGRLLSTVATLFDLEVLYASLFDDYGAELLLVEALQPMELQVWTDETEFPQQGSVDRPYYVPSPFGDYGATRLEVDPLRPTDLWSIGTQMILYRCLAQTTPVADPFDRFAAWAEIGLAEAMQARLAGASGLAQIADPILDASEGDWTLNGRKYGLENLIHLNLLNHYYGALLTAGEPHFSASHLFVEFLLQHTPETRTGYLEFLRGALADGKGDSSSAVDNALGMRIETLESPFVQWVETTTGIARRRRR